MVATFALFTVSLSGCSGSAPAGGKEQVLRLGALVALSRRQRPDRQTDAAGLPDGHRRGQSGGGVLNHRVELVTGDDACDPSTAITAVNEIVAKNITVSRSVALAARPPCRRSRYSEPRACP